MKFLLLCTKSQQQLSSCFKRPTKILICEVKKSLITKKKDIFRAKSADRRGNIYVNTWFLVYNCMSKNMLILHIKIVSCKFYLVILKKKCITK